jgi:hypothetical protein
MIAEAPPNDKADYFYVKGRPFLSADNTSGI